MSTKSKKWISVMMAFLITFTTFFHTNTTSVQAYEGEVHDIYMAEYPRGGDVNRNGQWGTSSKRLMNGWDMAATANVLYFRSLKFYGNNIAYCIEPGVDQFTNNSLTEKNASYLEENANNFNTTINGRTLRRHLGRLLEYGYHDKVNLEWRTQNPQDCEEMGAAFATQLLIWETVVGERDENFNHVTPPSGYDTVKSLVHGHVLENYTLKHYADIEQKVINHAKRPSFTTISMDQAQTHEMVWDGSKYVVTLTDTNNVLSEFNFSSSNPKVSFTKNGNQLTISSPEAITSELNIRAVKQKSQTKSVVIWGDGVYKPHHLNVYNVQDVATYGQTIEDPMKGFVKVKTSYGSMIIKKTSEDGKVADVKFNVSGEGVNQTYTTDTNGTINLEQLKPGTYTITEVVDNKYNPQNSQTITVVSGQSANVNFNNTLKRGSVKVTKHSEDGLVEGVKFKLSGTSLSGETVSAFAITDRNGVATFENILISGNNPYVLEEIETGSQYVVPANQNINVNWSQITNIEFVNTLSRGSMTIQKTSEDGFVKGVKFNISGTDYNKTFITDDTGKINVTNLLPGTYNVEEVIDNKYIPQDIKTITVLANGDVKVEFVNQLKRGDLKITKMSEDQVVKDVQFKLSGTSLSGESVELYATTNENGVAEFKNVLISGEEPYVIEELNIDGRYEPVAKQYVKIGYNTVAEKSFYNKLKRGDLKIAKTSEDGEIEGITFEIRGVNYAKTAVSNAQGEILVEGLLPGRYTVEEIIAPEYKPQKPQVVDIEWNTVSTVTFDNVLKRGTLSVTKTAEDGLASGVEFKLSGTSMSGDLVEMYATTNDLGVATFENVLISGDTTYTLEEVNTAIRYVIPTNQEVQVNWNEITNKSFNNVLKKWNVSVVKQDAETNNAQADAKLAGAVYGIYKDETLLDEYTTDADGKFTTKYYVCGNDYTLREIKASEGYLLDNTSYKVGVKPEETTIELNPSSKTVYEDIIKGHVAITKTMDTKDTQIQVPEPNAEFDIYLKSAGSYANAKTAEKDHIVTDNSGYAISKALPYGVYTVHQTKTNDELGLELMSDFDVFINEDHQIYRYIINNSMFRSYIRVGKMDKETGKLIPYKGTEYQIYDPDGKLVTFDVTYPEKVTIDTFLTDSNGILITPSELPHGKGYKLVEVKAPHGYVLDPTPIYFDLTKDNITIEDNRNIVDVRQEDMAQKGKVTIEKQGQMFTDIAVSGDDTKIYQPIYSDGYLKDATFEIYALEDIITTDGTKRYSKDELVDTIITKEDGKAQSKELYLGKYYVKETVAPVGFVLNEEIKTFELVYGDQTAELVYTGTSYYDQRKQVEISLLKAIEVNNEFNIGNNNEIANISFGLFAAEDITALNGKVIPANGMIEIVGVNAEGKATFLSDLPAGKYYVKEVATDKHYILDEIKYPFEFSYTDSAEQLKSITINNNNEINNNIIYGDIKGLKVNELDEALQSATIGLFKANETEFTKDTAIRTTVSDSEGKFEFNHIPYGDYLVREIKAPKGYVLDGTIRQISVNQKDQVIDIKITNTRQRISISIIKDMEVNETFNIGNNKEAINVTFGLYADEEIKLSPTKTLVKDELIEIASVDESGSLRFDVTLPIGKYYVKELSTDIHYLLNENKYPIVSEGTEDNALVIPLVANNGDAIENKLLYGSVSGLKVNHLNKALNGATIGLFKADETVFDTDHAILTDVSDKNGKFEFNNLPYGEYLIKEIKAPKGYITSDNIYKVTINEDKQVVELTVHNERQKVEISLVKTMEKNETFKLGNNGEIASVTFGLYANENILVNEEKTIKKNELIEVSNVGVDGKLTFKTELPIGKYYVQEITTDNHYVLDTNKYEISSDGTDDNIPVIKLVANNGNTIDNKLIYGSIKGHKVDDKGKDLSGAVIGLFNTDATEFTKENAIFTTTSGKKGEFEFANIPYGSYVVKEIKAPLGYILDGQSYNVVINSDKQVVQVEIVNTIIRGNVELTKVDADYPDNKLEKAVFEVYADTNANKKLDRTDKLVTTLEEYAPGDYHTLDLEYGRYFIKETKAPIGFELDENVYEVLIEENGKTYVIENEVGVGFINNAQKGELKIIKTSSDGNVKGFAFEVTGPNDYNQTFETDENGIIEIKGLRIGKYTVSEVLNDKSSAYELPEDKTVDIAHNKVVEIKMHNVYKETPQTGDNRNFGLWYGAAAGSAAALIIVVAIYTKKKKTNK